MRKRILALYRQQDLVNFYAIVLALVFLGLTLLFWSLSLNNLPSELPLFYSLPWGQRQLGSTIQFLVLPAMALLVILINLIISWQLHPSQFLLKRMLSIFSMVGALLILITALKVIYIFI